MAVSINLVENKKNVSFKEMPKLAFSIDTQGGYVKYGRDNLFPQELVRLYNEHPEHRSILNRKARYIWGNGLMAVNEADKQKVDAFINSFNKSESLNKVGKKIALNTELFNGQFIEVITNLKGVPIEMHFINSANCRLSEDGETLYFSHNWKKNKYERVIKEVKKFKNDGSQVGTFFVEFKYYTASSNGLDSIYPTPQYLSCINDVNTDIVISNTNSNMVNNGLSMGKILNFFNGKPDDKIVAEIDRGFKGTYTGEDGEAVMVVHSDRDDKAPELVDVTPTDMASRFQFTSTRAQKKIFAGHEMAPELFNIKFENSFLTGSPDLVTLQNLFIKGYVEPRQNDLLEFLSYLSFIKTGEYLKMKFEPISLVNSDLSNDVDLTQDERRILKGFPPLKPVATTNNGSPIEAEVDEYNEVLTGLSATERNDIDRIVRKFRQGKTESPDLAIASLTAYGFKPSQAKKFLGINDGADLKMAASEDKVFVALRDCAIDDNEDETLLIENAHIHNSKDALKYERHLMKCADALVVTIEELDNAILTALKGNPSLTIDELVAITGSEYSKVELSISRLIKKGYLDSNFKPTPKGIDKPNDEIVSDEIYTVYKYAVNKEKPSLKKGGSSRDFCKDMMALSVNKHWTFEQLDNMENDLGTNVWEYRGGFMYNRITNVIDPDCRHIWVAITKIRKTKK